MRLFVKCKSNIVKQASPVKSHVGKQNQHLVFVLQENYERMKVLVDELKNRTEKIKLGRHEHRIDYTLQLTLIILHVLSTCLGKNCSGPSVDLRSKKVCLHFFTEDISVL